jgi:hypothetical protein
LSDVTAWKGTIDREAVQPCPAAQRIREELFYSERLLLMIDRSRESLPAFVDHSDLDTRIDKATLGYQRLLDEPVTSLDTFVSQAQLARFRLGKSYAELNAISDGVKRTYITGAAVLASLFVLVSLVWGFKNLQALSPGGTPGKLNLRPLGIGMKASVLIPAFLVLAFFALPLFRVPAAPVENPTLEEQAFQETLDLGSRFASASDRAQARIWMLARIAAWEGRIQSPQAGELAERALAEAAASAEAAWTDSPAQWGEAQAAIEAGAGGEVEIEKASLVSDRLVAIQSRIWGARMAAAELADNNPEAAGEFLNLAIAFLPEETSRYRDLDLRAISVILADLDLQAGLDLARQVGDPALRSWGLREIAARNGETGLFAEAAQAAREVMDLIEQARLLREIGLVSGDPAYFNDALSALDSIPGGSKEKSYAYAELASTAGQADWASCDGQAGPAACASGYLSLEDFQAAWDAAAQIDDPYEQARAQAAVAASWKNQEAAEKIAIPVFKDQSLRDIAIVTKDHGIARRISNPYYQTQALAALGDLDGAWTVGSSLSETYPLVDLIASAVHADHPSALQWIEELASETEKAAALRAAAARSGDPELFERALGMAMAARKRGDPLAPAQASLELAAAIAFFDPALAQTAWSQAFDIASAISLK